MVEVLTGLYYYEYTMTLPSKLMRLYSQMSIAHRSHQRSLFLGVCMCVCSVGGG